MSESQNLVPLMKYSDVEEYTGLSRNTLRRLIDEGRFPEPLDFGPRSKRWVRSEVESWIDGGAA